MKNLDWGSLSFGYMKTDYNVRCYYRDGKWGEIEVCSDEYLNLHMAATCLHYGQEAFPIVVLTARCASSVWMRTPSACRAPVVVL